VRKDSLEEKLWLQTSPIYLELVCKKLHLTVSQRKEKGQQPLSG